MIFQQLSLQEVLDWKEELTHGQLTPLRYSSKVTSLQQRYAYCRILVQVGKGLAWLEDMLILILRESIVQ